MFRDLGLAFAIVLLLIYVLVVGWFQSFTVPLVIMAPIPLTLIGILPGHALTGAFFTATSMIGMIALAGIIVRNSILLVDFIQLAEARGRSLREAVLEAGAVRFRPIALTAAAVVVGGLVMVLDPIFPGPGGRADERGNRRDAAHHGRRSASLLGASPGKEKGAPGGPNAPPPPPAPPPPRPPPSRPCHPHPPGIPSLYKAPPLFRPPHPPSSSRVTPPRLLVPPAWFPFTAFPGLNLLESNFSGSSPLGPAFGYFWVSGGGGTRHPRGVGNGANGDAKWGRFVVSAAFMLSHMSSHNLKTCASASV